MQPRVLFLTLHTFSLTGGIEEVCRVFSRVLFDMGFKLQNIGVYSMYDRNSDRDSRYIDRINFRGYRGLRSLFVAETVRRGIRSEVVILSHINLLFVAVIIKKLAPKTRIVLYAHGTEVWRNIKTWKQKFIARHCEVWAVSEFTSEKLQQMHQVPAQSITVIPNCLDPYLEIPVEFAKPEELLEKYGLKPEQPVLFTLTRLSSYELYKGYDMIIETLPELIRQFPDLHYLLAGKADKTEQARLEHRIKELGLEAHVTLIGFIPDEDVSIHFLLTDIFVMPSRKEGFGIVFIEAAACGCRIIGGDQDGSPEALLQGRLGTLIDPAETESLVKAISDNLNRKVTRESALAIQSLCLEHFNYEKYLDKIQALLLGKPAGPEDVKRAKNQAMALKQTSQPAIRKS
ncbi:glycosyltransferase family 4 protein [Flavihumibacter sp. R14]|nr:glycosyltransferase family 4 protein [Flavihumibacter soli]